MVTFTLILFINENKVLTHATTQIKLKILYAEQKKPDVTVFPFMWHSRTKKW